MTKIYKDSKKISVTVGIPTFNEEENITHLLQSLLNQKDTHAIIEKIHIIDDMSKDNTVKNVSTFQDKRIQVLVRNKRLGQTSAQNIIFEEATTDVVLILEADTCPVEINYVDIMIQPLLKNSRIGYIQGSMIPLPSRTLLGKILNRHFSIFTKLVIENKSFHLPITSGRGGRIFAKAVYTRLRWPSDVPDDDYAAVWCIANNFSTYFCRKAHCHYQRPQSFNDYIKERQKIHYVEPTIRRHFSGKVIEKYFQVPKSTRYLIMLHFLLSHPLEFCLFLGLNFMEKFIIKKGEYTDFWSQTKTTRKLQTLEA